MTAVMAAKTKKAEREAPERIAVRAEGKIAEQTAVVAAGDEIAAEAEADTHAAACVRRWTSSASLPVCSGTRLAVDGETDQGSQPPVFREEPRWDVAGEQTPPAGNASERG